MDLDDSPKSRARQALPPIRTLLGPELDLALPPLPSSHSSHSASSWGSTRPSWDFRDDPRPSSSSGSSHRPQTRPRSSTVSSHRLSPRPATHSHSHSPSLTSHSHSPSFPSTHSLPPSPPSPLVSPSPPRLVPPPAPYPPLPSSAPPYSPYNVLRPSPSGGLITAPSLVRRPRPPRALEQPTTPGPSIQPEDEVGARRHVCPVCQKRFNRPSSLRVHESVHTGSRPFACPHPGCNKAFSVASNMRRHLRTHGYSASEPDPGPEAEPDSEGEGEDEPGVEGGSGYYEWAAGEIT